MSLFFGEKSLIVRYDQPKYPIFEKLTERQLSFFWRPEEVHMDLDKSQFEDLREIEKHVFISNLQYQILLDSIQARNPNIALLSHASNSELETFIEWWSAFESLHNRSYTHIIRGIFNDPSPIFDPIENIPEIQARAKSIQHYYDQVIENPCPDTMFLALHAINALEGIRFYASFACSFAFGERGLMESNAKIIKLIARDEGIHYVATQNMIKIMKRENRTLFKRNEEKIYEIFQQVAEQEKDWADYIFNNGAMIGLNAINLKDYVEFITNKRMVALGLHKMYEKKQNPLPWMTKWLNSDNFQTAPQESEITSYLVGAVDPKLDMNQIKDIKL